MSLYIYVPDDDLRWAMEQHLKTRRWTDSGFDLLSSRQTLDFSNNRHGVELKLGAHFAALDENENPVPYLLLARSSTSLTPLRMSNQIGLADAGYRGELIARVDCVSDATEYVIEGGRRLFQVVQHNWLPWKNIIFVKNLSELPAAPDNRGDGGFGSTGN
uniref:dUTPase-like domain-containing protein n=1 Tax=viral metagenome TaxID=1070528 RepID=A0A6C0JLS3_9ZZZZ